MSRELKSRRAHQMAIAFAGANPGETAFPAITYDVCVAIAAMLDAYHAFDFLLLPGDRPQPEPERAADALGYAAKGLSDAAAGNVLTPHGQMQRELAMLRERDVTNRTTIDGLLREKTMLERANKGLQRRLIAIENSVRAPLREIAPDYADFDGGDAKAEG